MEYNVFSFRLKLVCTIPSLEVNLSIFKLEVVLGCRRKWLVEMWTKKKTVRWWWWRDSDERGLTRAESLNKVEKAEQSWKIGEMAKFSAGTLINIFFFFARTLSRCCRYSFPISFVLHPQHTTSTFTSCSRFCAALCVVDYRILFSSLFDTSKKKNEIIDARELILTMPLFLRARHISPLARVLLSPPRLEKHQLWFTHRRARARVMEGNEHRVNYRLRSFQWKYFLTLVVRFFFRKYFELSKKRRRRALRSNVKYVRKHLQCCQHHSLLAHRHRIEQSHVSCTRTTFSVARRGRWVDEYQISNYFKLFSAAS